MALLYEVAERESILVGITAGETLVGHVEQREVTAVANGSLNVLPLLNSGVNTGGVVRASVQQENRVLRSILDIRNQSLNVKTDGLLVVVTVSLHIKVAVVEDRAVVRP